jgi:hypothetical protein
LIHSDDAVLDDIVSLDMYQYDTLHSLMLRGSEKWSALSLPNLQMKFVNHESSLYFSLTPHGDKYEEHVVYSAKEQMTLAYF